VVGLRHRGIEDGHDLVTDELHDRASLSQDERDDSAEISIEQGNDIGRIGADGERRETAQVGEQDGRLGVLSAESRLARVREQRPGDVGLEV
jgi:hypothetical protein